VNARDHFLMLARYNVWATDRLLRHVAELSDDEYMRDAGLYFKSVHGTLNHLLLAEQGLWFERFAHGVSPVRRLNEQVHAERSALDVALRSAVREWLPVIDAWPESRYDGTLAYTSTDGQARTVSFATALTHVFNHSTHHRGQITAAITAMGHAAPEIDLLISVLATQTKAP
jgi:uncharacterized damage-inducible protein DinB